MQTNFTAEQLSLPRIDAANNILRKCDLSDAGGNRIEALCNSLKSALNILGNKSSDDTEIIEIVRKTLFN